MMIASRHESVIFDSKRFRDVSDDEVTNDVIKRGGSPDISAVST
jgi:hypothetical protein